MKKSYQIQKGRVLRRFEQAVAEQQPDAGKDISSRNALTHGGTSEKLIAQVNARKISTRC
ncbi:MAG TPA: hypothetical protein VGK64_09155 [Bryobacteraceae bacterium]